MIKFEPVIYEGKGLNRLHTIFNNYGAAKLNLFIGNAVCPADANHQSVCLVDVTSPEIIIMDQVCCDAMKDHLYQLIQTTNFDAKE